MARTHYFPGDRVHYTWDAGHEPVLTVSSGDTVVYQTRDVSDNQLGPNSTTADLEHLDWSRVYPLAGPVLVDGAQPGDTLSVEILDLHPLGWGWAAILPGLGLLADEFAEPYLRVLDLSDGRFACLGESVRIPIEPFFGTMGVCPAGAAEQPVMPPGTFGGNLDTKQLAVSAVLHLPVQEAGALFSCGDAHAAQGDGEVCVTGIEAPMYAALRFTLHRGRSIPSPQFETPVPGLSRLPGRAYGTTGVGPDLYVCAQDAVRGMIDYLVDHHDLILGRTPTSFAASPPISRSRRSSTPVSTWSARSCRWISFSPKGRRRQAPQDGPYLFKMPKYSVHGPTSAR